MAETVPVFPALTDNFYGLRLRYQQTLGIGNKLRGLRRKPLQLTN
jgi:hypothetical protein